jgi:predicted RNase H-like HicB family nuclease
MAIKLNKTSSQAEYVVGEEIGHRFVVRTNLDEEWGWNATLTLSSFGYKSEEDAIEQLKPAIESFLKETGEEISNED